MKKKSFILLGLIFSVIHFAISFFSFLLSFANSTYLFDHPEIEKSIFFICLNILVDIFRLPLGLLYDIMPRYFSILGWPLLIFNSFMWGFGIVLIYSKLKQRKNEK